MQIDLSWKVATKNLLRNQRRSLSTAMALISGLIGMVLLSAYVFRVHKGLEVSTVYINHKGHVALFKKDSLSSYYTRPSKFMLVGEEKAQAITLLRDFDKEIEFTGEYMSGQGLLSNGEKSIPFAGLGVEPKVYYQVASNPQITVWAKDWVHGRFLSSAKMFSENPNSVSITPNVAELIGRKVPFDNLSEDQRSVQLAGQSVFGDLNAVDADLGPIHSTGVAMAEDSSIIVGLSRLQELYASDGIQYLAVFLKQGSDTSGVYKKIKRIIADQNLNLEVYPYYDAVWGAYYRGSMSFLMVMGGFFMVLICAGVALSIINSSTMNILERTKEIGTLLSLGFPRQYVVKLFVKEMVILTTACVVVGLILATIIATIVNSLNFKFRPPGVQGEIQFLLSQTWELSLIMSAILAVVSIVSCWYVTRHMTRKKIIDLLQTTGA